MKIKKKDPIAQAMAKKRWAKTTKEQRKATMQELSKKFINGLTTEKRAAIGARLAKARKMAQRRA